MASSFRAILERLANTGKSVELQKKIGYAVRDNKIDKDQANKFFAELVPIANRNEKPPEALSPSELADLREKFANLDGSGGPDVITRGLRNNQITKEETDAFFKGLAEKRKREGRGPARDTSNFNKGRTSSPPKPFTPSSRSGSSTPASQPKSSAPFGSNQTRESFTELLKKLKKSKADIASRRGKTNTPAPKVTAPAPSPAAAPAPRVTATAPRQADAPAPRVTASSAPSSQSGSNSNSERVNEFVERLKESKASTEAPAPTVSGPSPKVVNRPVTPTGNVTKPAGNKKDQKFEAGNQAIQSDKNLTKEQKQDLLFNRYSDKYGNKFDKGQFNFLLNKLTDSKIRQNRDAQSQERKNIYSRGLSSMFSNF